MKVEENLWLREKAQELEGISLSLIFVWQATKHNTTENSDSFVFLLWYLNCFPLVTKELKPHGVNSCNSSSCSVIFGLHLFLAAIPVISASCHANTILT